MLRTQGNDIRSLEHPRPRGVVGARGQFHHGVLDTAHDIGRLQKAGCQAHGQGPGSVAAGGSVLVDQFRLAHLRQDARSVGRGDTQRARQICHRGFVGRLRQQLQGFCSFSNGLHRR